MSAEQSQENATASPETTLFSKEEMENAVKARLKHAQINHEKQLAERDAQIRDLAQRSSPAPEHQAAAAAPSHAAPQHEMQYGIPAEVAAQQLPAMADAYRKREDFNSKIKAAVKEDKEFEELTKSGKDLPDAIVPYLQHLENSPAVIKHLLKDPKDRRLMEAAAVSDEVTFVKFINDLSTKLENNTSKPHASEFKPSPNLTNVGEAGEDFDIADYVSGKY